MIETGVEPYEFTPTDRITLYYDDDQYDLEWILGEEVGVYTIDIERNFHAMESGPRTKDLDGLIRNLNNDYRTDWRERKLRAIELYMNLSGLEYRQVSLRGPSQSDWADVVIYADPTDRVDLEACEEGLRDWFRGDVFTIAHESLEVYTNPANGRTIERWELQDSIGSILPVKGQTFEDMAKTYFGHLWEKQAVA